MIVTGVGGRKGSRSEAIDAFRGIAIIAVMAYHYLVRWAPPEHTRDLYQFDYHYSDVFTLGRYGVHVFFVISGLVITMTVLRSQSVWIFVARRFSRLWPPLAVAAVLTFMVERFFAPPEFQRTWVDLLGSMTFVPIDIGVTPVDGAYWSLAVEVKFYFIVAVAYVMLAQRFWIGVLAAGAASALTVFTRTADGFFFAAYWPYFLAGMAAWYAIFDRRPNPAIWLGGAAAFLWALSFPGVMPAIFIAVVAGMMLWMASRKVSFPGMSALGRMSYSLYLVHQVIGVTLIEIAKQAGLSDFLAVAAAVSVSYALGAVLFVSVERPIQANLLRLWGNLSDRIRQRAIGTVS